MKSNLGVLAAGGLCAFVFGLGVATATIPDSLQHRLDSLQGLIHGPGTEDWVKYDAEMEMVISLSDVDNVAAAIHAKRAVELVEGIGDTARIISASRGLGMLLRRLGMTDSSILVLQASVELAEKYDCIEALAYGLNSLASAYMIKGELPRALRCHIRSLALRSELGESEDIGRSLANIGLVYYKMSNYRKAIENFDLAIPLSTGLGRTACFANAALCYFKMGDLDLGYESIQKARILCGQSCSPSLLIHIYFGLGVYYLGTKRLDSAQVNVERSLKYARDLEDTRMTADNLTVLGEVFLLGRLPQKAVSVLSEAEALCIEGSYRQSLQDTYSKLSRAWEQLGGLRQAIQYKDQTLALYEEVLEDQLANTLAAVQIELEEAQGREKVLLLRELLELSEQSFASQRRLNLYGAALLILLVFIVFVLVRFARYQKRMKEALDHKVQERTKDLVASEQELVGTIRMQQMLMELVSGRMQSSIATIRGLWMVRREERNDEAFSAEFEKAVKELMQVPHIIQRNSGGR